MASRRRINVSLERAFAAPEFLLEVRMHDIDTSNAYNKDRSGSLYCGLRLRLSSTSPPSSKMLFHLPRATYCLNRRIQR